MTGDPPDLTTRPSLLVCLRDPGNQEAWNTFVEVYGPLVLDHCRRRGLQLTDAEDVSQEVFGRLSEAIRTFDYQPDLGNFRAWLGTVVRNEIIRFWKKRGRDQKGVLALPEGVPDVAAPGENSAWVAEFNAHLLQSALERCRGHFEEDTWQAFEMVWRQDQPPVDAARQLGRDIDWVYVAKSRVLKRLWQEVQELADDTFLAAWPES